MAGKLAAGTLGAVLAAGAMCGSGRPALAQTLVEHSAEARMQLVTSPAKADVTE